MMILSKKNFLMFLTMATLSFAKAKSHANIEVQLLQDQTKTDASDVHVKSSHYYNFGRVFTNNRVSVHYTVTNTGTTPLVFKSATIWGMAFDANHSCSKGLQPKEKCSFTIYFWPPFEQMYTGRFLLAFEDDYIQVDLAGEGSK